MGCKVGHSFKLQCCCKFYRCASKSASPTIGDMKALNKLARQLKSQPVKPQFWPLKGPLRFVGFPDASHRNNEDASSQRGMTVFLSELRVFLSELRERSSRDGMSCGSLIDYENEKDEKDCALNNCDRIVLFHEMTLS